MSTPPASLTLTAKILIVVGVAVATLPFVYFAMVALGLKAHAVQDCGIQLRHIGARCREYALNHQGQFPATWRDLDGDMTQGIEGTSWPQQFVCPTVGHAVGDWDRVDLWSDYRLFSGRSTNDSPTTILAIEPLSNHGRGAHVLFVDGRTTWWPAGHLLANPGPNVSSDVR